MYFVVNRTKEAISLKDIGIEIGPRKAIDLEQLIDRSSIEKSTDLKKAIKKGFISVRHRSVTINPPVAAAPTNQGLTAEQLRELLREEIQNLNKKEESANPQFIQPSTVNSPDFAAMMKQMAEITEALKNASSMGSPARGPTPDSSDEIDINKLADIHAKRTKRLGKDAEGALSYEEKKVQGTGIDDVLDILDNLDTQGQVDT